MKTVMLVDDERPARELLKLSIDWEKAGFRILWEARNGRQALEQYQQQKPDLIITDVQMPVMDGLELLKEIKRICPSQNIVILSCHENFSYARQALKYGVMDYLIKDALTEETLYSLLETVNGEESESPSTDDPPPNSLSILSNALSQEEGGIQKAENALPSHLQKGMDYFCCACSLEGFSGLSSEWDYIIGELLQALGETGGGDAALFKQHTLFLLCLMKHQSSKMDAFNTRFLSLRLIRQKLELLTGCSVSMGVSSQSSLPSQLPELLREAHQALESKIYQGIGKTIYYNPQYNKNQSFQIDTLNSHFQNIRTAVENLDETALQKGLSQIYSKGLSGIMHYNYLSYVNAILIDILLESCKKRSIPYEAVFGSESLKFDVFDKMNTVDLIYQWFQDCFFKLFQASGVDNASYSPRVRKIIDYIHKNYQQDLSLETIADTFWIHKVYLAKIFKQETGKSVNEYIRCVRIERAKELLLKDHIKINEIVAATGFNNPQSFYTLFKKYVGMKPGEYREQMLKNT